MTILDALRWANNQLKKAGIDSPMLDGEVLLSDLLGISRAKLFSKFNEILKPHQQEKFLTLIERRKSHEPIAYLIGKKSFYNREFLVNPFVLIPRPETEILVEQSLRQFDTVAEKDLVLFADIGTGSGAIAVTLAGQTHTPVIATDVSDQALSLAKKNAQQHHVDEYIEFRQGDMLTPILLLFETIRQTATKKVSSVYPFKYLMMCANLPYLSIAQMETLSRDVRHFEPTEALVAGRDGLEAYWNLFKQIKKNRKQLPRDLRVLIEIDPSQSLRIRQLIQHEFPQSNPQVFTDLSTQNRVVLTTL